MTGLIGSSKATAQPNPYPHAATLGVYVILNDFDHKGPVGNFSAMDAGLSLSYLRGTTELVREGCAGQRDGGVPVTLRWQLCVGFLYLGGASYVWL